MPQLDKTHLLQGNDYDLTTMNLQDENLKRLTCARFQRQTRLIDKIRGEVSSIFMALRVTLQPVALLGIDVSYSQH